MRGRSAAVVVVASLMAACSGSTRVGPSPSPAAVSTSEPPTPSPSGPSASAAGAPASLFVLRVVDQNGRHPSGIPVSIEGPRNATVLTDEQGEVRLDQPGIYHAAVATGCHDRIEVQRGDSGRVGLAVGDTREAVLQVWWRHRYVPSRPAFTDTSGGWPVDRVVGVRFDVVDRCAGSRAPGAAYPSFTFATTPNLVIDASTALSADADGYGWVKLRCVETGEVTLEARDSRNPSDRLDLLAGMLDAGGRPRCVAA